MSTPWWMMLLVACNASQPAPRVTIETLPPIASAHAEPIATIPNTNVEDTPDNRAVLDVCERYRHAMESRDIDGVLAVTSHRYRDGHVTYANLIVMLKNVIANVIAVRYEVRYDKISRTVNEVLVDFHASSAVEMSDGHWTHRVDTTRLVLVREDGAYRIIRGM